MLPNALIKVFENMTAESTPDLGGKIPAPTIQEILDNPSNMESRANDPFFAERSLASDNLDYTALLDNSFQRVIVSSETEALEDFGITMGSVSQIFRDHGHNRKHQKLADRAERLPAELRFIGRQEFASAAGSIATHWLKKLQDTDELLIGVEPKSSSAFVFAEVLDRVIDYDDRASGQITCFDYSRILSDRTAKERLRSSLSDTILVDDWTISGKQMRENVKVVKEAMISPDELEINLIGSTDSHLEKGIRGANVLSHFQWPYSHPKRFGSTTVTGSHSDVDFGFRLPIDKIYRELKQLNLETGTILPKFPLLHTVYRPYREDFLLSLDRKSQACSINPVRVEERERYRTASEQILNCYELIKKLDPTERYMDHNNVASK